MTVNLLEPPRDDTAQTTPTVSPTDELDTAAPVTTRPRLFAIDLRVLSEAADRRAA
ncbi:hypothetical protein Pth03_81440 [Planotetraspora thailandica]|uniref:Uncharacterized protein n=1 Tax=Planotetraspora thailandica TaxID=487172 RepID=A0A8J3Y309_9ACTN|nr:hypothetical protein [Planotetraspora thailandica]GII59755.1 hypothetical protein Pth03_81440 [Planotetraspora thailandica]